MKKDFKEVIRYLGGVGSPIDEEVSALIGSCMEECEAAAKPKYIYNIYDIEHEDGGVRIVGTDLVLEGADISTHLLGAKKCALLAVTLGASIDSLINAKSAVGDITVATVIDACATVLTESVCDSAARDISVIAKREGYTAGCRYSAGYGDLPIDHQPLILGLLDTARKIGLTCTDSKIMLPRKSVTAIIGFYPHGVKFKPLYNCSSCNMRDTCLFKRTGV